MKLNRPLILAVLLFFYQALSAQGKHELLLNSGSVTTEMNITRHFVDSFNNQFSDVSFLVIQFETIPKEETRKLLSAYGIELL